MTYLRRAFKYLIQITLIFIVIIAVLMLSGMVSKDITVAFRNGWTSIAYILGLFVVMSAAYPFFGYGKRNIHASGEPAQLWPLVDQAMKARGYQLASDDGESRKYRLASQFNRAARMWEDTITVTSVLGGFQAEGLMRDLARAITSIQHKINY